MSRRITAAAVGLFLFVLGFTVYFRVLDARMEGNFAAQRGNTQIMLMPTLSNKSAGGSPASAPAPASPTPPPAVTAPVSSAPVETPSQTQTRTTPAPITPAPQPVVAPINTNVFPLAMPPSGALTPRLPGGLAGRVSHLWPLLAISATDTKGAPLPAPAPATAPAAVPPPAGEPVAVRPVPIESSVIVLGYHQFCGAEESSKNPYVMRADVFESEMKYLQDNGYTVVPLSDVIRFVKHEIGLPPRSVAITIDDGYKSPYIYAYPILKKYKYPWTFFCYPDFISASVKSITWEELKTLQADGVDIECHSKSHPLLTHKLGKTPEQYDKWLTDETAGAKAILEQHLGTKVVSFAYPYGDYNKQVEAKAIEAGYEAIFTVANNPVHTTTPLTCMGRYIITKAEEKNFATYLHQGALSITDAEPAAGSTISQPRPVIHAILSYFGNLDPHSVTAEVRELGRVRCDFDQKSSVVRIYLQRDLTQHVVSVTVRAKDLDTKQVLAANWRFTFEPGGTVPALPTLTLPPAHPALNSTSNAPVAAPSQVPTPEKSPSATTTSTPTVSQSSTKKNQ